VKLDRQSIRPSRRLIRDGAIFAVLIGAAVATVAVTYDQSHRLQSAMLDRLAHGHVQHWSAVLGDRLALSDGISAGLTPAAVDRAQAAYADRNGQLVDFRIVDTDGSVLVSSSAAEIGIAAPMLPAFELLRRGDQRRPAVATQTDATSLAHARLPIFDRGELIGSLELSVNMTEDAAAVVGLFDTARTYGLAILAVLLAATGGAIYYFSAGRNSASRGMAHLEQVAHADRGDRAEVLAYLSHQIRTPLNTMMGFAEVIRDDMFGADGKAQYKTYAAAIRDCGARVMDTLSDVIDLSHPDANDWQLAEEEIDVIYLANQALEAVRTDADARSIRLSLVTRNPITRLQGDKKMALRMVSALMSHAVGQSVNGGQCRLTLTSEADGSAVFQASDASASQDDLLTGLHFALSGGVEANLAGSGRSGAGLALARILAERHGAIVELSNRIGGGTCIRIRFPATRSLDAKQNPPRRLKNPIHNRLAAKLAAAT